MSVLSFGQLAPQVSVISYILFVIVADDNKYRVRPKAEVLLSAKPESRPKVMLHIRPKPYVPLKVKRDFGRKPKPKIDSVISASLSEPTQATVPDADVDSADSFISYLYIVSQYTVSLMIPCVWRILCLRNSSSVSYFRQAPNLPTAARWNRKCTECGTTTFGRNRMSAESAHLSAFGAEAEIRSISNKIYWYPLYFWVSDPWCCLYRFVQIIAPP